MRKFSKEIRKALAKGAVRIEPYMLIHACGSRMTRHLAIMLYNHNGRDEGFILCGYKKHKVALPMARSGVHCQTCQTVWAECYPSRRLMKEEA